MILLKYANQGKFEEEYKDTLKGYDQWWFTALELV